jgi:DtxR family transcriptional regulator, manganese transport regulator
VNRFDRTRRDHRDENSEDYVEMILGLQEERGEARVVVLAERLGVSPVTVTKTVQRLVRQGLVKTEPYRAIFLTDKGTQMAVAARERHEVVLAFLEALGVSHETAQHDSEGIEHHVSEETLAAMRRFLAVQSDQTPSNA